MAIDPNTGAWTYTPTYAARHNAAADGASATVKTDTVTITVSDGHGGTDTRTVSVDLTPQLDPNNATVSPVGQNAWGSTDRSRVEMAATSTQLSEAMAPLPPPTPCTSPIPPPTPRRTIAVPLNSVQPVGGADSNTVYVTDASGHVNVVNTQTGGIFNR